MKRRWCCSSGRPGYDTASEDWQHRLPAQINRTDRGDDGRPAALVIGASWCRRQPQAVVTWQNFSEGRSMLIPRRGIHSVLLAATVCETPCFRAGMWWVACVCACECGALSCICKHACVHIVWIGSRWGQWWCSVGMAQSPVYPRLRPALPEPGFNTMYESSIRYRSCNNACWPGLLSDLLLSFLHVAEWMSSKPVLCNDCSVATESFHTGLYCEYLFDIWPCLISSR